MRRTALILVALCWVSLAGSARASIIYQYVTDQTNYVVQANQTLTVNLYLQETVTGGSSSLLASEGGLFGAGLYVGESGFTPSQSRATTITGILPNNLSEPNGFTGLGSSGFTPSTAFLSESVNPAFTGLSGPSGTTTGGSVKISGGTTITRVYLGQLTLQVGGPGDTTFQLLSLFNAPSSIGPLHGHDGNTLTFTNFVDLDPKIGRNPSFTGADSFVGSSASTFDVTVVPEPTSLALFLASATGLGACRAWRRSRRTGPAR
jgi:hypothetical protein